MRSLPAYVAVAAVVLVSQAPVLGDHPICDLLCSPPCLWWGQDSVVPTPQRSSEVLSVLLSCVDNNLDVLARLAHVSVLFRDRVTDFAHDSLTASIRTAVVLPLLDPALLYYGFKDQLQVIMGVKPAQILFRDASHPMRYLRHPSPVVLEVLKSELTPTIVFQLAERLSDSYSGHQMFVKKAVEFFVQRLDCRLLAAYMMGRFLSELPREDRFKTLTLVSARDPNHEEKYLKTVLLPHYDLSILDRIPDIVSKNIVTGGRSQIRTVDRRIVAAMPSRLKRYLESYDLDEVRNGILQHDFDQIRDSPALRSDLYQIGVVFPLSIVFYSITDQVNGHPSLSPYQFRNMAIYLLPDPQLLSWIPDLVHWGQHDLLQEVLRHQFWTDLRTAMAIETIYFFLFGQVVSKFGLDETLHALLRYPNLPNKAHELLQFMEDPWQCLTSRDPACRKLLIMLQINYEILRTSRPDSPLSELPYEPELVVFNDEFSYNFLMEVLHGQ